MISKETENGETNGGMFIE
jgi:hypothetical protein